MARRKAPRRQRVIVRSKRRSQLLAQLKGISAKLLVIALVGGVLTLLALRGDSFLGGFERTHTPRIDLKMPPALAGVPVLNELPRRLIWLWIPGSEDEVRHRVVSKFPAVKDVRFQRSFGMNRIAILVEPRKPLVVWGEKGLDAQGVLFPAPRDGPAIPKAVFLSTPATALSQWIAQVARKPELWSQVAGLTEDRMGNISLDLTSGTRVIWGKPEPKMLTEKTASLLSVLQDAHQHLGGSALADLRFFDEGRIIVRPKGKGL
jgi:hypothetical protein